MGTFLWCRIEHHIFHSEAFDALQDPCFHYTNTLNLLFKYEIEIKLFTYIKSDYSSAALQLRAPVLPVLLFMPALMKLPVGVGMFTSLILKVSVHRIAFILKVTLG